MSSEDTNIKQLELRISLPVKFTSEVDEYRKKIKDMLTNYVTVAQDENLSEGAIQREALKLFSEFREDQTFDKQTNRIQKQRKKQNEEYYGGAPQEGGFLDQRERTLDQGRLKDYTEQKAKTKESGEAAKLASQASLTGRDEFKNILGKQSETISKGANIARGATTGGLAGIISSIPGLGILLNNPLVQAAGAGFTINEIYKYIIGRLKEPGQPNDPRYIIKLVEQAIDERFRSRDTQAALRLGEQNIISTQQQGFQPLDVGLTRNTLQDVVRQGYADIGLRGAGVR